MKKIKKTKLNNFPSKYGVSISNKAFIVEVLGISGGVLLFSLLLKLNGYTLLFTSLSGIIAAPPLIITYYKQLANAKKFSLLTDYLSNIIPIFIQKSKIRYTLSELYSLTSGVMKESVDKAIKYIDTTKDDPNLFANALKIIEKEFNNSRVKSVHKLLLAVEANNSKDYKEIANNLYEDIEAWIERTYTFEKDLINRRNKLIILCIMTLLMDTLFTVVYAGYDFFQGYTKCLAYQISTAVFIVLILGVAALVLTKLNGEWLINDVTNSDEEEINRKYDKYKKGKSKITIIEILISLIFVALGVYAKILGNIKAFVLLILLAIILITQRTRNYYNNRRLIHKLLKIEFPIWLREVSLSLGSLTVLNAIENSINNVSYPFRKELRKFLTSAYTNPTSIKPYNEFLLEYDLEEARSSMRVLYAINNVAKNEMKNRISYLIHRNQALLAKSEKIRNDDSISGVETLGFLPIIIFCIQIVMCMFIMFFYTLNNLSGMAI